MLPNQNSKLSSNGITRQSIDKHGTHDQSEHGGKKGGGAGVKPADRREVKNLKENRAKTKARRQKMLNQKNKLQQESQRLKGKVQTAEAKLSKIPKDSKKFMSARIELYDLIEASNQVSSQIGKLDAGIRDADKFISEVNETLFSAEA
jgi:predicted  nucleic acid-binding Zn-ribbon protein